MSSPDSSDTVTESSDCLAPVNLTPVLKVILRRRNARSSILEANSSSLGTSRGSASTTVTSRAEALEHRRELHADDPAAEDDDPLRAPSRAGWPRCW